MSHAHSDHTAAFRAPSGFKYAHPSTAAIHEALTGRRIPGLKPLRHGEALTIGAFKVKPHNAGHILGSTLYEVEVNGEKIVYTGDLNCVDTVLTDAAERVECDTLIIEATYGRPDFRFPERQAVYRQIVEWTVAERARGRTPVIRAYTVGKAQELIALLNRYTQIPVAAHGKIQKVNTVYAQHKIELYAGEKPEPGCAYIHPHHHQNIPLPAPNPSHAVATGWAAKYRLGATGFPLSSHADFPQLLQYVKETRARRVYVSCGFQSEFSQALRRMVGVEATPLPKATDPAGGKSAHRSRMEKNSAVHEKL